MEGALDPADANDRADAAHHFEITLKPTLVDLTPGQKADAIGAYIQDTGIAPIAALDILSGLVVTGEPADRIAEARRLIELLRIDPAARDKISPALGDHAEMLADLVDRLAVPPKDAVKTAEDKLDRDGGPHPGLLLAGETAHVTEVRDKPTDEEPDDAPPSDDAAGDEGEGPQGEDAAKNEEGDRPDGRLTPGLDAAGESSIERERLLNRETAPQPVDEASKARPLGADLLADLDNERLAIQQGTSPVVRRLDGTLNYRLAPQSEQDLFDEQNMVRDPSKFVVLRDPETNGLTVFERAPETDEGGIARAGRLLGLGLAADPIRFGRRGITKAVQGTGRDASRAVRVATADRRYVTKGNRAFVALEDGTIDFGQIDNATASKIRREPAPIRLPRGDARFGEQHISRPDRAAQIAKAGFESPAEFVLHVARNFDEIWEARGQSLQLIKRGEGKSQTLFVDIRKNDLDVAYEVTSGGVFRSSFAKGGGRKLLWERERTSSTTTGK